MTLFKRFLGPCLAVCALLAYAPHNVEGEDLPEVAVGRGVGEVVHVPLENAEKDLYDALIRNGLFKHLDDAQAELRQNFGTSTSRRIARWWHVALMHELRSKRFPESWISAAANMHKKLGGQGDFIAALHPAGYQGSSLNAASGSQRAAFLSLAYLFLTLHVPQELQNCVYEKSDAAITECLGRYTEAVQSALFSTLTSYFQYIPPQYSASRIPAVAFVLAAVSPCPFGFMAEPAFIKAALTGGSAASIKALGSLKQVAGSKSCPEFRKQLLRALMISGITPGDIIRAQGLADQLKQHKASARDEVEAVSEELNKLGEISADLLGGEDEKTSAHLDSSEIQELLTSFLNTTSQQDIQAFFDSTVGKRVQAAFQDSQSSNSAFLDRVLGLAGSVSGSVPPDMSFDSLLKQFADTLESEARENPQRVPRLLPPGASKKEQAEELLKQSRNFSLHVAPFMPTKEDDKSSPDAAN
ncbi:uncharacterized protein LOC34622346 [Cyclospora cayetanensis]|uniref:Uncharacterized protein LOC34622346 n=1 Tax=Cyclospora cayetanensis TaxID=88456 RepID=A0A6P5WDY0_9EIME|nr:uncharacterized protein LOC34622346 [Cyclospora cayetanensis]